MRFVITVAAAVLLAAAPAVRAGTLEDVRARGALHCGVTEDLPGFSAPDPQGRWRGLDVDVCRAVAAAVLGDAEKVRFTPLSAQRRFTALQSGEVDLLARNTTYTLTRDAAAGMNFTVVNYYDGQGFLVWRKLGATSARGLDGATICVQTGTTNELNVSDFARAQGIRLQTLAFEKYAEAVAAYLAQRCDAFSTDRSTLAVIRSHSAPNPAEHVILPELISNEPLAPAVRHGDDRWYDVVKWVQFAMINAEEMGLTQANVANAQASPDPSVRRFVGAIPGFGAALGLDERWAAEVVRQVGNYGESFERAVGSASPLDLPRGSNALASRGGLMFPMPMR